MCERERERERGGGKGRKTGSVIKRHHIEKCVHEMGGFVFVQLHMHIHTPAPVSAEWGTLLAGWWHSELLVCYLCRKCEQPGEHTANGSTPCCRLESCMQICVSVFLTEVNPFPLVSSLTTSTLSQPGINQCIYFLEGHGVVCFWGQPAWQPIQKSLIEACYQTLCRPGWFFSFSTRRASKSSVGKVTLKKRDIHLNDSRTGSQSIYVCVCVQGDVCLSAH